MNSRERFLATMRFEPVDRVPLWEFGYWGGTVRRWYAEGLPQRQGIPDWVAPGQAVRGGGAAWDNTRARDFDVQETLALDPGMRRVPLNIYFAPSFEIEILEDHGEWMLWRDEDGIIKRDLKNKASLPAFVRAPVQSREDWEQLKAERLRPTMEGRLPDDWPQIVSELKDRDYPLAIGGQQGFYGTPRYLLGEEKVLTTFYDDPDLISDINDHMANLWITIYGEVIKQVKPDLALIWEDMCYKSGSLISPAMFRRYMLPYYQRLTSFLRDSGIDVILVDTDGDLSKLIPLFVEGGVTGIYPWEVMAGMDVVKVREQYPRLQLLGGIDKTQLALGKDEIDKELNYRVPGLLRQGGYIPYVDHLVPPDVPWDNFQYYRRRLADLVAANPPASVAQ
ncbi:MAG: uroporphyrinogen decarboxylase family protein [Chloroflexota bacterium]